MYAGWRSPPHDPGRHRNRRAPRRLVSGISTEEIGDAARQADLTLYELTELSSSLEQAFLQLTADSLDYAATSDDPKAAR